MSDPRYPGSPNDPYQPGDPTSQQPVGWQPQQPADPAWQPQQQPTDPAWQQQQWQGQPQQPTDPAWQQQQWQPAQQPPPKKPRTWLRTAIVLGVVALIVVGFIVVRDRLPSGVTDLAVGECMNDPAGDEPVSEVPRQPCNEPHDGEVFAVFRHPGGSDAAYPSTADFRQLINDQCLPAIQSYTGRTIAEIETAGLDYSAYYPTAEGWADGDRGLTCFITKVDGTKLVGSVRAGAPSSSAPNSPPAPASP